MSFERLRPSDALAQIKATAHRSALTLLTRLRELNYNIVTAESLTAGLIAATLVDIPTFGANVYGALVVYDTDAKRRFLGVTTQNVYTLTAAKQMSEGALRASRAIVGLSVTGHGGPTSDPAQLGVVHVGVSLRTGPGADDMQTRVTRLDNCGSPSLQQFCAHWTREVQADEGECQRLFKAPQGCSSLETLSFVREAIRWETTARALDFVVESLDVWQKRGLLPARSGAVLPLREREEAYVGCHEPSGIIRSHLIPAAWSAAHPAIGAYPELVTPGCPEAEPLALSAVGGSLNYGQIAGRRRRLSYSRMIGT